MSTEQPSGNPSVWVVRAGKNGEDEDTALDQQIAIIGFQAYGDATGKTDRAEIGKLVEAGEEKQAADEGRPMPSPHQIGNFKGQFFAFVARIQIGDIIVLPLKTRPGQIAIGRCQGAYEYREVNGEHRHVRAMQWDRIDVQRTALLPDLRRAINRPPTVFRITQATASQRFDTLRKGESDPGLSDEVTSDTPDEAVDATSPDQPLQERARNEISDFIRERFTDHKFARLIEAILEAQGYVARLSPPGRDGGVDILAGRGPLGFDHPRLCVQVKATAAAADVKVVRELQGTMQSFRARHGLFVCWGGFTRDARNWARDNHFKVRLWDADDVVEALQDAYDKLGEEIRAEIPLKQVWTLVQDDDL